MARNKGVWLLAIYLFLAVYILPMFPHGGSANELTRWATAASLIERHSFEISWTEDLIGPNVDTAKIDGRTYSNKAPGTAVLAAPFYALSRVFTGPPDASNIRVSWFVMRFALASLPLFLLGLWLYRKGVDEIALAILLFANPLFVYSLLFFSHVFVAVIIYFAFRLIYDKSPISSRSCLYAGALSGLAVVCEFPALFAVAAIGGGLLFAQKKDRMRCIAAFVAGGLPFAILLLLYNNALFGSPFSMSYAHESFPEWAEVAGQGVFGIGFPTVSNAFLLLLSPSRGLFFTAPILLLAAVMLFRSNAAFTLRQRVRIAAVVVPIILLCGHGAAHGGWAFGPRYLVFVIPFLLDPFFDGELYEYSNVWKGLLFAVSLILCVLPALTFPFAPPEFAFPHNSLWMSYLAQYNWFVPNMANVFGAASTFWTIVPVLLSMAIVTAVVYRTVRRPNRFLYGLAAGVFVTVIYLTMPGLDKGTDLAIRRDSIAERYFSPASRLTAYAGRNDVRSAIPIEKYQRLIDETRSHAPDDFPYLPVTQLAPGPAAAQRSAVALQQKGQTAEAENVLRNAAQKYPSARCEINANLGVIYYTTNRRELAQTNLEDAAGLVTPTSPPDCMRSLYLLGTIYSESSQQEKASAAFQRFLAVSQNSTDSQIMQFRRGLQTK